MTLSRNIIAGSGKAIQFAVWGAVGGAIGSLVSEPIAALMKQSGSFELSVVKVGLWFGVIGACIAVTLLIASSQYLKRGLQIGQAQKNGVLFGFVSGAISGAISQYTYRSLGPTEFLRVICWGIAGALLGFGLSFRLPNLGKLRGAGGGLAGGLLGGGLFVVLVVVSGLSNPVGRLVGCAAIGFCIGLMIVLIEVAFREVWLEVRYSSREIRTISLGAEPVSVGGNPNACTVYVPNAPPVALRFQLNQGQILCEDISANTTHCIHPGDRQMVGNVAIVVCAAGSAQQSLRSSTNVYPRNSPGGISSQAPSQLSLRIKRQVIPLTDGTCLKAREIPGLEPQGADDVVAEVSHNPKDPSILGLKNTSHRAWVATLPGGERKQIESGRSIKLAAGTRINFGSTEGEIQI
ncbi:MAG TPA: hypothetical protein V6C85_30110 [Allocoleopsis sp.]